MPLTDSVPKGVPENIQYRLDLQRRAANDTALQQTLLSACSHDLLFFVNVFCWTHDPRIVDGSTEIPFITYPFQDDLLLEVDSAIGKRDLVIPKSRDQGATWCCLYPIIRRWMFRRSQMFMLVSRTERLVDRPNDPDCLFYKCDFTLQHLPFWMRPKVRPKVDRTQLILHNPQMSSTIAGASTTSDIGRGGRTTATLCDEFAAFGLTDGFAALGATQANTRCRLFPSTPKGVGNAFYKVAHGNTRIIELHWSNHPVQAKGLYTSKKGEKVLLDKDYWLTVKVSEIKDGFGLIKFSEDVADDDLAVDHYPFRLEAKKCSPYYDQECLRSPVPSLIKQELDIDWLGSGSQFFDPAEIRRLIDDTARDPDAVGMLTHDDSTCEPEDFLDMEGGELLLWGPWSIKGGSPMTDRDFVIGCDVSTGSEVSNSCAGVIDLKEKVKVAEYVTCRQSPHRFAEYVFALGKWFKGHSGVGARIIFEQQGPGFPFSSRMKELNYGRLYHHRNVKGKISPSPGWPSTADGKYQMLVQYAAMMSKGDYVNRSRRAIEELGQYEWGPGGTIAHNEAVTEVDYSGAKRNHGDRVIMDMLGCHLMKRTGGSVAVKKIVPYSCLEARNRWHQRQKQLVSYW